MKLINLADTAKLFLNETKYIITNINITDSGLYIKFDKQETAESSLNKFISNLNDFDSTDMLDNQDNELQLLKGKMKKYAEEDLLSNEYNFFFDYRLFENCVISSNEIKVVSKESLDSILLEKDMRDIYNNDGDNKDNIDEESLLSLFFDKNSLINNNINTNITDKCLVRKKQIQRFKEEIRLEISKIKDDIESIQSLTEQTNNKTSKIINVTAYLNNSEEMQNNERMLSMINEKQLTTYEKLKRENLNFINKQKTLILMKEKERNQFIKALKLTEEKINLKEKLIKELQIKINSEQHRIKQNTNKKTLLNKILLELNEKLSDLNSEYNDIKEEQETINAAILKNNIAIKALKSQIQEINDKQETLKLDIQKDENKKSNFLSEIKAEEQQLDQIKQEIHKLLLRKNKKISNIKTLYEEIEIQNEVINRKKEERNMINIEKTFVDIRINNLSKMNIGFYNKTVTLKKEAEVKESFLNSTNFEITERKKASDEVNNNIDKQTMSVSKLFELLNNEKNFITGLNEEKEEINSSIGLMDLEIKKIEFSVKNSQQQINNYNIEIFSLVNLRENNREALVFNEKEFLKEISNEQSRELISLKNTVKNNIFALDSKKKDYKSRKSSFIEKIKKIGSDIIPSLNILFDSISHIAKSEISCKDNNYTSTFNKLSKLVNSIKSND